MQVQRRGLVLGQVEVTNGQTYVRAMPKSMKDLVMGKGRADNYNKGQAKGYQAKGRAKGYEAKGHYKGYSKGHSKGDAQGFWKSQRYYY